MQVMTKTMILAAALLAFAFSGAAIAADVEQAYKFYCAQCHGLTGEGDVGNEGGGTGNETDTTAIVIGTKLSF